MLLQAPLTGKPTSRAFGVFSVPPARYARRMHFIATRFPTSTRPGQALGLAVVALLLLGHAANAEPMFRNVVLILSDDHRYDFLGFHPDGPEFLETPNLDRMASQGAHLANTFVTTSLCSPSRATILTGQYMHRHKVVDNQRAVPQGTRFFPEYL
ncbi:uncharacterized protein METZ01_LOCUS324012, partial [marine metagenome]